MWDLAVWRGAPDHSFCTMSIARGPDILIVAIAPVPGGVAIAAMVSVIFVRCFVGAKLVIICES